MTIINNNGILEYRKKKSYPVIRTLIAFAIMAAAFYLTLYFCCTYLI